MVIGIPKDCQNLRHRWSRGVGPQSVSFYPCFLRLCSLHDLFLALPPCLPLLPPTTSLPPSHPSQYRCRPRLLPSGPGHARLQRLPLPGRAALRERGRFRPPPDLVRPGRASRRGQELGAAGDAKFGREEVRVWDGGGWRLGLVERV